MYKPRILTSRPIRTKLSVLLMVIFLPTFGIIVNRGMEQRNHEIKPDDRRRVNEAVLTWDTSGHSVEYRIVRPDGSISWMLDHCFPIRDESGKLYRIFISSRKPFRPIWNSNTALM